MRIELYTHEHRDHWDTFVRKSKNATFLLLRDFIEYHGNRFSDHSLLFYSNDQLLGLMPGNEKDGTFYSHQGLTYGGLVMSETTTVQQVIQMFDKLIHYLRQRGNTTFIYKAIPHIYHQLPAEEDLYALFRHKAELIQRNLSSTVLLPKSLAYSNSRSRGIQKAEKRDIRVEISDDMESFWKILTYNLDKKYHTLPVHSLQEINYLKQKFPQNIQLYAACDSNNQMLAGCLTFEMPQVVHAQYTAGSEEGKRAGAVDAIIDHIIENNAASKLYFDYGTSTEENGELLNENLIYQKQGFGARAIVYDVYKVKL